MISLAAPDATMYWLSRRTRNDQFLLYCFAESTRADNALRAEIRQRCAAVPELRWRLRDDPTGLSYPVWIPAEPTAAQIEQHRLRTPHWPELLAALGRMTSTGVDARESAWRLHIFRGIHDSPAPDPQVTVVVLQISHALVDGRGAARIARALFTEPGPPASRSAPAAPGNKYAPLTGAPAPTVSGSARTGELRNPVPAADGPAPLAGDTPTGGDRAVPVYRTGGAPAFSDAWPAVFSTVRLASLRAAVALPVGVARTFRRGMAAARARNELAALTAAGQVPPPGTGYPPGPLNRPAEVAGHGVRMLVCPAADFRIPGLSVTVLGLTVVSIAVEQYLRGRGEGIARLGAQVPMALPPRRGVRNNYRSLGVDLAAGEPAPRRRAAIIAAELAARRERARHPLLDAQDAVEAVLPPLLLRRDVGDYPIHTTPEQITGHTVVSSVNRGPADLSLGGAPVRFTAGFPALGSVMHLTHGIHGLGDTVTLSVHADPGVVDLDTYADRLRAALRELPRLQD